MSEENLAGGFADPPTQAARAFRAALDAIARPGRIHRVEGVLPPRPLPIAAGVLALTLCDAGTPLWLAPSLASPSIPQWLAFHAGAPVVADRGAAAFAFGTWDELAPFEGFPIGTPDYPDRSATLVILLDRLEAEGASLAGPGIAGRAALSLPAIEPFRRNAALFPLGLDCFLCAGDRLAALPR
ncbi:MAG TPA: phosphonate C-P lyase system protein PhnH, partial [Paracoccaceae bacterium]|nr:phosphonate C-P lyase system protein PhnH [Paracoccaceae bacterium]